MRKDSHTQRAELEILNKGEALYLKLKIPKNYKRSKFY